MALKMTFLGSGSAFTIGPENYNSNILFELDNDTLLLDAGVDVRHALHAVNRSYKDIHNVYISHLHGDHCGGLEWLALTTYFYLNNAKLKLFASDKIIGDLWDKTLAGGLSTLEDKKANLQTYFTVQPIKENAGFTWHSIDFQLVKTVHFYSDHCLMPSYGLFFTYNKTRIFFTGDTQFSPKDLSSLYEEADLIFHDCETLDIKSGVHAHYSDLVQLPAQLKKKMWLYHYNPGTLPDAKKEGFLGFVAKGQSFLF